ncbi:hypothetical protein JT306_23520 [Salmonella enterica subsp. enterica serovar Kentucky]|nr:hypothetical protein [Salmonella enterica subsp. enterica serovar Kentucky]
MYDELPKYRFIPAGAGTRKTLKAIPLAYGLSRWRGNTDGQRGQLVLPPVYLAGAGNTAAKRGHKSITAVYPRWRGNTCASAVISLLIAVYPRWRGNTPT